MRIAIFVEGRTELVFLRALLSNYLTMGKWKVSEIDFRSHRFERFVFRRLDDLAGQVQSEVIIIDSGSDETVLTRLKQNYKRMKDKGFSAILGLRDLQSRQLEKYGSDFIANSRKLLSKLTTGRDLQLHFAKMTTEAWFLADWTFLQRLDSRLNVQEIKSSLNLDLAAIDPQEPLTSPSKTLEDILRLVNMRYCKHEEDIKQIVRHLDWHFLLFEIREQGKISCFFEFIDGLDEILNSEHT